MIPKQVLEILADQGVVEKIQIDDILQEMGQTGKSLVEVLGDFLAEKLSPRRSKRLDRSGR